MCHFTWFINIDDIGAWVDMDSHSSEKLKVIVTVLDPKVLPTDK